MLRLKYMENYFNEGDFVWPEVNHHPWWPRIIYHEQQLPTDRKKVELMATITKFDDLHYVEKKTVSNLVESSGWDANYSMGNMCSVLV
ncbi:hypothetical protein R6Q59_006565 [Mikania micrantha]